MAYGPVSISGFATADVVAPGAPTIVFVEQVDNTTLAVTVAVPVADATGGDLSGLTTLTLATASMSDGLNPFEGLSMPEILALGAVSVNVELTPEDAGTQKVVSLAIVNLGGFQALAAACNDE